MHSKIKTIDIESLREYALLRNPQWDKAWEEIGLPLRKLIPYPTGDAVFAYLDSVGIKKWLKQDFTSLLKLWNRNLIPTYCQGVWRLYTPKGEAVFQISHKKLCGGYNETTRRKNSRP